MEYPVRLVNSVKPFMIMAIYKAQVSEKLPILFPCSRVGIHTCLSPQQGMRSHRIRWKRGTSGLFTVMFMIKQINEFKQSFVWIVCGECKESGFE